jgi:hypothetical protein
VPVAYVRPIGADIHPDGVIRARVRESLRR